MHFKTTFSSKCITMVKVVAAKSYHHRKSYNSYMPFPFSKR